MKRHSLPVTIALFLLLGFQLPRAHAEVPFYFNYQGRVTDGTNLVNGIVPVSISLYSAPTGGDLLFQDLNPSVEIVDGLYRTYVGDNPNPPGTLLQDAITNDTIWLEVTVDGTTFSPREQLTSVPFALRVYGMRVARNGSVLFNPIGVYSNVMGNNSEGAVISGGMSNRIESLSRESIISGGRANHIESFVTAGVIAGGKSNRLSTTTTAPTISGGEENLILVNCHNAAIGGGRKNITGSRFATIAGGASNSVYGVASVVGGGLGNTIIANDAVIGGGNGNWIREDSHGSVIQGGYSNRLGESAQYSTIGGGYNNVIELAAVHSVIPGGISNIIASSASYSFAGGQRAVANHPGSFVWGGNGTSAFTTTAANQFMARASGGFGINTAPGYSLHVLDDKPSLMIEGSDNSPAYLRFKRAADDTNDHYIAIGSAGQMVVKVAGSDRMTIATNGYIGIGISNPTNRLHVAGNVTASAFVTSSDRTLKTAITPVSPRDILDKVEQLPVAVWQFKDTPGVTHMGPMAQDFHAAFGLGNTDAGITTVDADGVALAAIQALAEDNRTLRAELDQLRTRLEELEAAR